jgi:glycosyltransferase involved in cell wall biosynthesis
MFFIVLFKYRKARIIAITNPPSAPLVPYLCRADYDVLVYDLYPDALVNFNYIAKAGLLNRIFVFFTRRIFNKAKNIFTLTPELAKETAKYTDSREIKVVPIWTNNEFFPKIEKASNKIYSKINFSQDDFIICYSGNLGRTHPVEKLVELAENSKEENLKVLIIGGGYKYDFVSNLITQKNLNNIMILPWQPIELLPHNIQIGDINVVTLDEGAADLSIPSKTFNLLSVGKPILAICSNKSALANLLHHYNCGEAFESNNVEGIISFIKRLKTDTNEYNSYCMNAIEASKQFTKENAKLFL